MTKEGNAQEFKPKTGKKLSQSDVPAYALTEALRVARAIFNDYGGDATKPLHVAAAMDVKPSSSQFRMLAGAAVAYGLTTGGPNADLIGLTDLAKQILRPLEEGAESRGKCVAFQKPRVVNEFLEKYDGSPLPQDRIAKNVLSEMGVPDKKLDSTLALIVDEAESLGLTTQIKGSKYITLASPAPVAPDQSAEPANGSSDDQPGNEESDSLKEHDPASAATSRPANSDAGSNRKVFITHGKNKDFVEPIRKLLRFGELEAVVSVEKQSVSKPVPEKVMEDMRSCGAAIIHVDGELTLMDQSANEHKTLNPNVLIEIGAAMALFGRRFILLVKEGVELPSNLQGLYEVRYSGETLDGDATIRILEAINDMKSEGDA